MGDMKENYCQVRISNMGSIVRYSYFVNDTEALANIQAQFDLRDFLQRSREVQAQNTAHNRLLEGLKLPGILSKYIQMFKDRESTGSIFNKDHIIPILLMCYETNTSSSSKKGNILKFWNLNSTIIQIRWSHVKYVHFLIYQRRKQMIRFLTQLRNKISQHQHPLHHQQILHKILSKQTGSIPRCPLY